MSVLRKFQPFPLLFAYAWVVGIFALSSAPLPHLWRPLAIALIATLVVIVPPLIITRGRLRVQLIAGLVSLTILAAWPFVAVVVVIAIWRIAVNTLRKRQGRAPVREDTTAQLLRIANGVALIIAAVATVNVALTGALEVPGAPAGQQQAEADPGTPNIYVVLLDGYPRADTLSEAFGFDNSPFTDALADRGFQVIDESRSNYTKTLMTLASTLNMNYTHSIDILDDPIDDAIRQSRQLTVAINSSEGVRLLREHGYEILASGAAFGDTALMSADSFFETGHLTRFEEQIAHFTWLATVLDFVAPDYLPGQHRDAVEDSFGILTDVADSHGRGPFFMLTHVLSPHSPFLTAADGLPRPPPDCFPSRCSLWDTELQRTGMTKAEYTSGLVGQTQYLNEMILSAVDEIQSVDPDAVIALFSDHGIRYDIREIDEFFLNFLAVYSPSGQPLLPNDASPVNLLPYLFNEHLGTDLPVRPYEGWCSGEKPFDLVRVEEGYESACITLYTGG